MGPDILHPSVLHWSDLCYEETFLTTRSLKTLRHNAGNYYGGFITYAGDMNNISTELNLVSLVSLGGIEHVIVVA